jgi:hypothetical protein
LFDTAKIGLMILTSSFYRPAGMLPAVAGPALETFRNKNPSLFARIIDKVRHGQRIAEHSCR